MENAEQDQKKEIEALKGEHDAYARQAAADREESTRLARQADVNDGAAQAIQKVIERLTGETPTREGQNGSTSVADAKGDEQETLSAATPE